MKTLLIIDCTDPLLWYSHKVGTEVQFLYEDEDYYWSREDAGYRNIVWKKDAIIKETPCSNVASVNSGGLP